MKLNASRARDLLKRGELRKLFIEELGWDNYNRAIDVEVEPSTYRLQAIANKRGFQVFVCQTRPGDSVPDYSTRRKIERQVVKTAHEHLIVFCDAEYKTQIWQWVRREHGRPAACREHYFSREQSGEPLLQRLDAIAFSLDEEEKLALSDVTGGAQAAFDVERVTKRFYDRFQKEHTAFVKFIEGITDRADNEWYASLMLNRLMFVYFIQRKGFLDGDLNYLRNRLGRVRLHHGKDKFYSFYRQFLLRLFHEGLGGRDRNGELDGLLGRIPYLNGGLFEVHELEKPDRYGSVIQIPDKAFERIFEYFDEYQWHLDERPLRNDKEINPDVLGYIFEKYINQKQMGAYYTKEDVTEYIGRSSVLPFLLDSARAKCRVAFDNPQGPSVWDLLSADPDRYIQPAMRHGEGVALPDEIAVGVSPARLQEPVTDGPVQTLELRKGWNRGAPSTHALATETWREVASRRTRLDATRRLLAQGTVRSVNDLITLNLDIRQFAQDVIEGCEGPDLLRALWHAIEEVTILDPTCGSGAFLFAALNILEPLYEACLDRMEAFVADLDHSAQSHRPEKFADFRRVLARVKSHPNRRYFIFKSIILRNLYGVDIMEEAVEICKLRLFLKLAAQVEPNANHGNLGIEPLPDIDFNIRAGNSLVGYAKGDDVKPAATSRLDFEGAAEVIGAKAADLQLAFDAFRSRQVEGDGTVPHRDKRELRKRLTALGEELNRYLAGEYGIDARKTTQYDKWLKSHQPFHWFVEFYGIVHTRGGFDVIVGNPPYLEYSKVKTYTVRGYETARCANLYAFTFERSLALVHQGGRVGLIVPVSLACSGALQPLRGLLASSERSLWLSHFSNRPGQLFAGAQNRLTIAITSEGAQPRTFSTRYHRWDARNGERENLFPTLHYQEVPANSSMFGGLLPKFGEPEAASLLTRIGSAKAVGLQQDRTGKHSIFWVRVPGYFCQFFRAAPMVRPEGGGVERERGELNELRFREKVTRDAVHSVLNSSTYYQFFCAYTDTRHINPSDVAEFPLDLAQFAPTLLNQLVSLSEKVSRCFKHNTTHWRKSGLLIDSTDAKPCKGVLDEIDVTIARHFGFTESELDFVINYDMKYRMGRDVEDDGEE